MHPLLDILKILKMDNPNPKIFSNTATSSRQVCFNDATTEEIDSIEIFDLIKTINDPEHPVTLEQLNVVRTEHIYIVKKARGTASCKDTTCSDTCANKTCTSDVSKYNNVLTTILVHFTPTIPHCSMATLIGLSIQLKLIRSLSPSKYRNR